MPSGGGYIVKTNLILISDWPAELAKLQKTGEHRAQFAEFVLPAPKHQVICSTNSKDRMLSGQQGNPPPGVGKLQGELMKVAQSDFQEPQVSQRVIWLYKSWSLQENERNLKNHAIPR